MYDIEKELDYIIDNNEYYIDDIYDFLWKTNPYITIFSTDNEGNDIYKYKNKNIIIKEINIPPGRYYMNDISLVYINEEYIAPTGEVMAEITLVGKDGKTHKGKNGIRQTYFYGYSRSREFYNPSYKYTNLPDINDYRRTLYWNPEVKTDKNGVAKVSFYNNGTCRELDISAEGLTNTGIPFALQ